MPSIGSDRGAGGGQGQAPTRGAGQGWDPGAEGANADGLQGVRRMEEERGRGREMEGRMVALEKLMEKVEERVVRLEGMMLHSTMERVQEREAWKKEVARLEEKLTTVGEERVRQAGADRRGERDDGVGEETEKLQKELREQMEVMRREMGELRGMGEGRDQRDETRPKEGTRRGRVEEGGGERGVETRRRESAGRGREERVRRRCVVLTDSNGRGVTSDTIMTHVRGEAKEKWEVQVERVYTLEEARDRVRRGDIRVDGARVVVDCVTNDVRGTRRRGKAEPQEVAERLREAIGEMGRAERIVVCEVKPMQHIDVVPFNARINGLSF